MRTESRALLNNKLNLIRRDKMWSPEQLVGTHGQQTPLSLYLRGVARETIMHLYT